MTASELFTKNSEIGDIGENLIRKYAEKVADSKFEDFTANPLYFAKDIDFYLNGKTIEVKTDTKFNKTGKLFLEINIEYAAGYERPGWFKITEAEQLYYIDAISAQCYIIDMQLLISFVEENKNTLDMVIVRDGYKEVTGYLFPQHLLPKVKYTKLDLSTFV